MRIRPVAIAFLALFVFAPGAHAHRLEPISTEFARPFAPRTGSLQLNYEYERGKMLRRHFIPEAEFEIGIAPRMQIAVEMPLILEREPGGPTTVGGGHLEISLRYLLAGGSDRSWALSLNPFVELPTGNRRLAGDATEVGLALHLDKEFGERAFFHGNYGWSSSIGGSEEPERTFRYNSALVVRLTERWNPTLELLGATDTATGETEFFVQPEMIYYAGPHWEFKLGVPLGATSESPRFGIRAQISWIFGGRGSD